MQPNWRITKDKTNPSQISNLQEPRRLHYEFYHTKRKDQVLKF
uniref:Uncharacterized protein n=1 Tax=Rhizophora mucronata TaxID=61149 RepID=A0A2P2P2M7_RHIMU